MKLKNVVITATAALMLATNVYADTAPISAPAITESQTAYSLYINDVLVDNAEIFKDTTVMIPLRKLCETLGIQVEWNGETETITLTKGPVYITCTPNADGYTFAKTAPLLLGTAPQLIHDTTFVPLSFANEVLQAEVKSENNRIDINYGEEAKQEESTAVYTGKTDGKLSVYDLARGEVELNLTEETAITDSEGKALKAEDLKEGTLLAVVYDNFMTMSLPPITNALRITVKSEELYDVLKDTIVSVEKDDAAEGAYQITIGKKDDVKTQKILNVNADTVFTAVNGEATSADALKAGMEIASVATKNATKSVPEQRAALTVTVTKE